MNTKFKNQEDAISTIIFSAEQHSIASEEGNYKIANKNYDKIHIAIMYLRNMNSVDKLYDLLSNEKISVRLAVASYLLSDNPQKAIPILQEIVSSNLPHKSFTASLVLQEWEKGNLKL
ncbi:hypothetical protein FACS189413_07590 [Bacteroidia bacterium]|nr:hypothetical protein FACS189413_07590 [Bacteroidia bacterium]